MLNPTNQCYGVGGGEGQWSEIEEVGTVATGDRDHLPQLQACTFLKPLSGLKGIPVDPSTASLLSTQALPWGWPGNFQLGQPIVWPPAWVSIKDKTRRTRMKLWHEKSVLVMGMSWQIMTNPMMSGKSWNSLKSWNVLLFSLFFPFII